MIIPVNPESAGINLQATAVREFSKSFTKTRASIDSCAPPRTDY
jgi:hypothetical protein